MSKDKHFIGQPIFGQLLNFVDKGDIRRLAKSQQADRYIKKLDGLTHFITILYAVIGGFDSLREVVISLLSNATKLSHLSINYSAKRSTLADANKRRASSFFGSIYKMLYTQYACVLSDSHLSKADMKRLYIMDSTTITLFKEILKGVGRNSKSGKKKGGIKAHTLIRASENTPCLIRYTGAATHDHILLKEINLAEGSIIVFDKGYVDYAAYEQFTTQGVWYVTKLKSNALYSSIQEIDIPETADTGILIDEIISLRYGKGKELVHTARRIAYWDEQKKKVLVFLTNNTDFEAEMILEIYRRRWQIELLFKQLKQNFPLKYFLGDNVNAIEIQIWTAMIANLLLMLVRSKVKRQWAFSNMTSLLRGQLMSYINLYSFLNDPEKTWREKNESYKREMQLSFFPT